VEHAQHYRQPPVLMEAYHPADSHALAQFLGRPQNSIWLAMDGENYMGYLRFEVNNTDSAAIVAAPDRIANTGAYIRPQYRGRKAAVSVLNAALRSYADQGFRRCSVDFESFNPEAVSFWLRYFEPVCFSLLRVPERQTQVPAR
jgi:ribosomal protein S18 acetylase RimI-like enzyme